MMNNLIYRIEPVQTPWLKVIRHNRRKLGRFGKSARSIKRRMGKPLKFSPCFKNATFHEWRRDKLIPA